MNLAGNVAHYRIVNFDDWAESLVRVRFEIRRIQAPQAKMPVGEVMRVNAVMI
jgi:hypothetical protein